LALLNLTTLEFSDSESLLTRNSSITVLDFTGCVGLKGNIGPLLANCKNLTAIYLTNTRIVEIIPQWNSLRGEIDLHLLRILVVDDCISLTTIRINTKETNTIFNKRKTPKLAEIRGSFFLKPVSLDSDFVFI